MNILITGAGKGIGFELCSFFARGEEHTILGLSRNTARLIDLSRKASSIIPISFDLNHKDFSREFRKIIQPVLKQKFKGRIDIIINNAGLLINKKIEDISDKELTDVFATNVFAPFRLVQHTLPYLGKSNRPHIVNIGSMGGYQGSQKFPGLSVYSSSKAALSCLSECMAEEFRKKNIAVNSLCLGAVRTEMLEKAFPGYKAPVSAADIARYIGHFALEGHYFFNGKVLPVSLSTP